MKPSIYAGILLLVVFFFSSCLYRNVRGPGPTNQITQFNIDTDDFEILGTVESTGTYKTWVWLVSYGGNTHMDLLDKARAMGGDDIIHYRYNVTDYNLLFIIYNRFTYHATATVIKYKPGVLRDGRFRRREIMLDGLRVDDENEEDPDDEAENPKKDDTGKIVPKPAPAENETKMNEKKEDE